MKTRAQKDWEYTLYEKGEALILSVTCGRAAVYTVDIRLEKAEIKAWEKDGEEFLAMLAARVRRAPERYQDRRID